MFDPVWLRLSRKSLTTIQPRTKLQEWGLTVRWMLLASILPLIQSASGQSDATWIGGAAGDWSDGTKWSTSPLYPQNGSPNASDLFNAAFGANATVTLTENITIERLTSTASLTLTGDFEVTLRNGMALDSSSATTINQATVKLSGGTSAMAGTGNLTLLNGATLHNEGLLDIQSDADFVHAGGSASTLYNAAGATLRKSGGSGITSIGPNITLVNSGIIDIDSGILQLNSGNHTFNDGTAFTGSSLTKLQTLLTLNGTISANGNVQFAGASIQGTHTLRGGWYLTNGTWLAISVRQRLRPGDGCQ